MRKSSLSPFLSKSSLIPIFSRKTKTVKIGKVKIGSGHPVSVQSMAKTDTADINATVRQIKSLEKTGCEIIRVAVKNIDCAKALDKIKSRINIPLIADIHFNYWLGLEAINRGVDAIRLNPGNIYRREEVKEIALACKRRKIPIRVGVNSGSLRTYRHCEPPLAFAKDKLRGACPTKPWRSREAISAGLMAKSALNYIKLLESFNFYDIIVSLKASDVTTTVAAYRKLARKCRYPFHLGITAAGLRDDGAIKSAMGIGCLLLEGIGDTIRVSLTGSPEEEIKVARQILQGLGLRNFGPEILACPTCGRTQVDIARIARELSRKLNGRAGRLKRRRPPKVAIMGCEVNGPGEAREADIGVACGRGSAVLFRKGRIVKKISEAKIVTTLLKEIKNVMV